MTLFQFNNVLSNLRTATTAQLDAALSFCNENWDNPAAFTDGDTDNTELDLADELTRRGEWLTLA